MNDRVWMGYGVERESARDTKCMCMYRGCVAEYMEISAISIWAKKGNTTTAREEKEEEIKEIIHKKIKCKEKKEFLYMHMRVCMMMIMLMMMVVIFFFPLN